ncbi:MAG: septum formation initiator family protein [Desulfobacteraceae bacterium]|nr:septum formation initiator family protein [Desulfobacteraceae bacterium]
MFFYNNLIFKGGVVVLFILLFLIIFSHNGLIDYFDLCEKKQLVLLKNKKIEEKNSKLSLQINRLKNDKEYIGHVAKHEFGMAAADELVFRTTGNRKTGKWKSNLKNGILNDIDKP